MKTSLKNIVKNPVKKLFFLLFILPLSACFDADMTMVVHDAETATMTSRTTFGAEMAAMITQAQQDPCNGATATQNSDGSLTCSIEQTDTIDNLMAEIAKGQQEMEQSGGVDPGQGLNVEQIDGGVLRVSVDLGSALEAAMQDQFDPMMVMAFQDKMIGHGIKLSVSGPEIVSTTGTLSADGTTATFALSLTDMLNPQSAAPKFFEAIVKPD